MAIYFIPVFIIGLGYIYKFQHSGSTLVIKHKYDVFLLLAVATMVVTIGIRGTYVGSDTPTYEFIYRWYGTMPVDEMIRRGPNNALYLLACAILYRCGIPFQVFSLLLSLFTLTSVTCFIVRYLKDQYLGILVYLFLDFYILNFSMIRQSVALAICLLYFVIKRDDSKDKIRFALCYICAVGFHTVALIFLPVFFVSKWKYNKNRVYSLLGVCVVTYIIKDVLLQTIYYIAIHIDSRYSKFYEMNAGGHAGLKLYILLWGIVIASLLLCSRESKETNATWIYMILICIAIFPFLMSGGVILRAMYYYMIFVIALIPQTIDGIKNYSIRSVGKLLVVLTGFIYYFIEVSSNTLSILPYRTFWQ